MVALHDELDGARAAAARECLNAVNELAGAEATINALQRCANLPNAFYPYAPVCSELFLEHALHSAKGSVIPSSFACYKRRFRCVRVSCALASSNMPGSLLILTSPRCKL
eukprot:1194722-Prorocentrum_minimum.AAC.1